MPNTVPSLVASRQAASQVRFKKVLVPAMRGQVHIPDVVQHLTARKVRLLTATHICELDPLRTPSEPCLLYTSPSPRDRSLS
eukprot:6855370-Pyramimonas_sp.AAC.1